MLDTYLFIPANRNDFIAKIPLLKSNYFIIDFEDSVSNADKLSSIENIKTIHIHSNWYARPNISKTNSNTINLSQLEQLLTIGFKKFVIPKIDTFFEFEQIIELFKTKKIDASCILLVESPKCLIQLEKILEIADSYIQGISLGSHDFSLAMGMEHTLENIHFARQDVLMIARAYNKICIDIASMDISATHSFVEECRQAISLGFDGKFFIHPKQLESFNTTQWFTSEQIHEAKEVYAEFLKQGEQEFSLIKLHGRVYEKPHLYRIKKIIDWSKKHGNK